MLEKKQIAIVAAIIKNEKGEILLAKRNQPETPEIHGKWEFVGGGVDFGENPQDAVKREVMEEIGVEVEVIRLLPKIISDVQEFNNGDSLQVLVISYECKIISGTPKPSDGEIAEIRYFAPEEVEYLNTFRNINITLQLLKS